MDSITRYLGIGSYAEWDEYTRRNWLQAELSSKRPLLPRLRPMDSFGFSATVVDTLKTFELAATLGLDFKNFIFKLFSLYCLQYIYLFIVYIR